MSGLISLIVFLIIIGVVVFVHELGHFLAAKLSGTKVEEFAIGFGPKVFSRAIAGTIFRLNIIPLGGYVKLHGDRAQRNEISPDDKTAYSNKNLLFKALILLGGILMNMLFAILLSAIYLHQADYKLELRLAAPYTFSRQQAQVEYPVFIQVFAIVEDSPAQGVLEPGDRILALNGSKFAANDRFVDIVKANAGGEIALLVQKPDGSLQEEEIQLPADRLGVEYAAGYTLAYVPDAVSGISYALDLFGYQIAALSQSISASFQARDLAPVSDSVGSIVAVGVYVDALLSQQQFQELFQMIISINLALAFFNLLPIPVLDGGQLTLEVVETATRRKISAVNEDRIALISFVFLMGLGVLVIFKDLWQFQFVERIISFVRSVLGR